MQQSQQRLVQCVGQVHRVGSGNGCQECDGIGLLGSTPTTAETRWGAVLACMYPEAVEDVCQGKVAIVQW